MYFSPLFSFVKWTMNVFCLCNSGVVYFFLSYGVLYVLEISLLYYEYLLPASNIFKIFLRCLWREP